LRCPVPGHLNSPELSLRTLSAAARTTLRPYLLLELQDLLWGAAAVRCHDNGAQTPCPECCCPQSRRSVRALVQSSGHGLAGSGEPLTSVAHVENRPACGFSPAFYSRIGGKLSPLRGPAAHRAVIGTECLPTVSSDAVIARRSVAKSHTPDPSELRTVAYAEPCSLFPSGSSV
jgi:hypothetical protein